MSIVRVKGIRRWRHPTTGIWYCYHRKSGTRITAEFGSPAFFAELSAVEQTYVEVASKPGTLGLAIEEYRKTPAWLGLRPKTRVSYERAIAVLSPLSDMPLAKLSRPFIFRLRDRKIFPAHGRWMANYVVTFLSLLMPFCRDYRMIPENPLAERIKKIRRSQDDEKRNRPWGEAECRVVLAKAPPHIRLPIALAMCAGLRKGDLLTAELSAIDGDALRVTTSKAGKPTTVPIHPLLAAALKARPRSSAREIAVNSRGEPWTETGFNSSWSKFRNGLLKDKLVEPGLTIHGLRHTFATRLKEAGADDGLIADLLANTIPRHYSATAKLSGKAKKAVKKADLTGEMEAQKRLQNPD